MTEIVGRGALAKALAAAQGAMDNAHKDAVNPHFGKSYATLAAIWDAVRKPLSDNGLSVVQMPEANGHEVRVITLLLHESGESVESTLTVLAADASIQKIGSAITYARRYALAAICGIAPEDDDGNDAQPAPEHAAAPSQTRPQDGAPKPQKIKQGQVNEIGRLWSVALGVDQNDWLAHFKRWTGKEKRDELLAIEADTYITHLSHLACVREAQNNYNVSDEDLLCLAQDQDYPEAFEEWDADMAEDLAGKVIPAFAEAAK